MGIVHGKIALLSDATIASSHSFNVSRSANDCLYSNPCIPIRSAGKIAFCFYLKTVDLPFTALSTFADEFSVSTFSWAFLTFSLSSLPVVSQSEGVPDCGRNLVWIPGFLSFDRHGGRLAHHVWPVFLPCSRTAPWHGEPILSAA